MSIVDVHTSTMLIYLMNKTDSYSKGNLIVERRRNEPCRELMDSFLGYFTFTNEFTALPFSPWRETK